MMQRDGQVNQFGEPLDLQERIQWATSRLWAAGTGFFFVAWFFAFVYLKTIDANGMWHPAGVNPNVGLGIAILVCILASAALHAAASSRLRSGGVAAWRGQAAGALALGLIGAVLMIVQLSNVGFGWGQCAYASVFVGWTMWYMVFTLGGMYQLETLLASSSRVAAGGEDGVSDLAARASAFQFFWWVMAGVEVVAFLMLYVVR